ncbi:hypothetical protein LI012_02300 [Caldibacillus thermoamylovorans]|nr:hypothetical protein [Caldibacillus thermoamylovorans]MCB5933424.1 hypothetical protein [Bacillus sp. DFI.2.34]MCB7075657.1 hypothetical protein [Caldibacillus thermoamylovorans]
MSIFLKKTKTWTDYIHFSQATDISQVGDRARERLVFLGINLDTVNHVREAAQILLPYKDEIVN